MNILVHSHTMYNGERGDFETTYSTSEWSLTPPVDYTTRYRRTVSSISMTYRAPVPCEVGWLLQKYL